MKKFPLCLLCQMPLPQDSRPWWRRWMKPAGVPAHPTWPTSTEADKDTCWKVLNIRLGNSKIGPRPR